MNNTKKFTTNQYKMERAMENTKHFLAQIFQWIIEIILLTSIYFASAVADKKAVIVMLLIFLVIDTITGIAASIKQGKLFKSNTLFAGLFYKAVMFFIVLIIAIIIKKEYNLDVFTFIAILGCISEATSINENMRVLTNNKFGINDMFFKALKVFKTIINEFKNKDV